LDAFIVEGAEVSAEGFAAAAFLEGMLVWEGEGALVTTYHFVELSSSAS
jgi:hypothetical protein